MKFIKKLFGEDNKITRIGDEHFNNCDYENALKNYNYALIINKNNLNAKCGIKKVNTVLNLKKIAIGEFDAGNYVKSKDNFKNVLKINSSDNICKNYILQIDKIIELINLAISDFDATKYENSISHFKHISILNPKDIESKDMIEKINKITELLASADVDFNNCDYENALNKLNIVKNLNLNDKNADQNINLINQIITLKNEGQGLYRERKYSYSVDKFKKVLRLNPKDIESKDMIEKINKITELLASADVDFNNCDYENALNKLNIVKNLNLNDKNADQNINLINQIITLKNEGQGLYRERKYSYSVDKFKKVLRLNPKDIESKDMIEKINKITEMINQGNESLNNGDFEKSLLCFSEISNINSADEEIKIKIKMINEIAYEEYIKLGKKALIEKYYDDAIQYFKKAINFENGGKYENTLLKIRAIERYGLGEYPESMEYFKKVLDLNQNDEDSKVMIERIIVINNLLSEGDELLNNGDFKQCLSIFYEISNINPNDKNIVEYIGKVEQIIKLNELIEKSKDLIDKKEYKNSIFLLNEILKIDEFNKFALYNLGICLYYLKNYSDSLEYLNKYICHYSGDAQFLEFRGTVLQKAMNTQLKSLIDIIKSKDFTKNTFIELDYILNTHYAQITDELLTYLKTVILEIAKSYDIKSYEKELPIKENWESDTPWGTYRGTDIVGYETETYTENILGYRWQEFLEYSLYSAHIVDMDEFFEAVYNTLNEVYPSKTLVLSMMINTLCTNGYYAKALQVSKQVDESSTYEILSKIVESFNENKTKENLSNTYAKTIKLTCKLKPHEKSKMLCKIADSMYEKGFDDIFLSVYEYALNAVYEIDSETNEDWDILENSQFYIFECLSTVLNSFNGKTISKENLSKLYCKIVESTGELWNVGKSQMLCKIADSMYEKGFNNESMSSCEYALKTIQELNDADNYAKSQELCTISNLLHKNKFDVKSISVYMQVLETAKNIDWNRMTKNYESNYWDEDEYPKLCNAIEWFEKLIISLENNPYAAKDDLISLYITILDFVSEFSCDPCEKLENLFKVINSFEKRITSNKIIGLYDKSIKIAEYRWQDHYYHYSPNILKSFEKLINSFENNPHTKKEEVFKIYNVILDIIQNSSSSDDLEESENLFKVINSFEKRITSNKIIGLYDKALDVLGKFNDENISENLFKIIESFEKRVSSDKLLELYDKSIKIAENIWDKWHSSLILLKMANLLWHKGLRDKSINTYDKSIKLSKKINSNKSKSIVLSKISKSLSKNGLIDKAYTVTCEIPLEEYKSETLKHISGRSNP